MRRVLLMITMTAATLPTLAQQGQDERSEDRASYNVLTDNNIFLRQRARPQATAVPTTREAPPPPSPEQTLVLTGIVFEDGAFRAYFENRAAGGVTRVTQGDPIARGRVSQIMIDSLAYESDGQTTWVNVGQDLTASAPRTNMGASASTGTATTGASGGGNGGGGNDRLREIEERMRRAREEGR